MKSQGRLARDLFRLLRKVLSEYSWHCWTFALDIFLRFTGYFLTRTCLAYVRARIILAIFKSFGRDIIVTIRGKIIRGTLFSRAVTNIAFIK